jgi:hypothetical protein
MRVVKKGNPKRGEIVDLQRVRKVTDREDFGEEYSIKASH